MPRDTQDITEGSLALLVAAAMDRKPVTGWTHNFYRYPARFSPSFAAAAIKAFSKPGDVVVDPYMGGATALVEGVVAGRQMIGNDLNSLAAFIARVKITCLTDDDIRAIRQWATLEVPKLSFRARPAKSARTSILSRRRT